MDRFPVKNPGDSLEATHVNDLSDAARQITGLTVGGNISKHQSGTSLSLSAGSPWYQYTFEITGNVNEEEDGYYKGKTRWWDSAEEEWKNNDTEYQIDTTDSVVSCGVGDKIVAYWDKQRGMFLPCSSPSLIPFELYGDLTPGDSAEAWAMKDDGDGNPVRDEATDKVTVYDDVLGNVRAYGSSHSGFSVGATGWAQNVYGYLQVVSINEGNTIIGKLDGSLSVGGSATVSVWAYNGSSVADSGVNITAYDWLLKTGATAIASGKKVVCQYIGGRWFITEAECA